MPVYTGDVDQGCEPGRSRRSVLAAAVGATLGVVGVLPAGGCGLLRDEPVPPPPDPLDPLLRQTLDLAGRYELAITGHPELAARLAPLRDAHRAHADALARLIGRSAPSTSGSADPASAAPGVPADPARTLAALRAAEQAGQRTATDACLAAAAERTALLGSITAARASHQEALA